MYKQWVSLAGQFLIQDEVKGYECRIFKGKVESRAAEAATEHTGDVSDEELLCVMSIEKRLFSSHHHSYMDGGQQLLAPIWLHNTVVGIRNLFSQKWT